MRSISHVFLVVAVVFLASMLGRVMIRSASADLTTNAILIYKQQLTNTDIQPLATDNHQTIVTGAHGVFHISAYNNSATIASLRLYDAASGFNGCASATNLVYQALIPGNAAVAGFVEDIPAGIIFLNGISACITGGYTQTDVTAAPANSIVINIGWK